jgi:hypothetical protein
MNKTATATIELVELKQNGQFRKVLIADMTSASFSIWLSRPHLFELSNVKN